MRRKTVVREGFPVRQIHHHLIGKLADFIMQTQSILHIWCNEYHRTGVTFGNFRYQRRAGSAG